MAIWLASIVAVATFGIVDGSSEEEWIGKYKAARLQEAQKRIKEIQRSSDFNSEELRNLGRTETDRDARSERARELKLRIKKNEIDIKALEMGSGIDPSPLYGELVPGILSRKFDFNVKINEANGTKVVVYAEVYSNYRSGIPTGTRIIGDVELKGIEAKEVIDGPRDTLNGLELPDGLYVVQSRDGNYVTIERVLNSEQMAEAFPKASGKEKARNGKTAKAKNR